MFTGVVTNDNMPEAIQVLIKEVRTLRKEVESLKDTSDWVKLKKAIELTESSKVTLRKYIIEDGEPVSGFIRTRIKNCRVTLYNRNDLINWKEARC